MKTIATILSVVVLLSIAAWAETPASRPATSQPTSAANQAEPKLLVKMHHEEGWDVGTVRTFVLNDDGAFSWVRWQDKKPAETLVGTLPKDKGQALMDHLAAAGAGVGAKDAGEATFEYVDSDKVNRKKQYTYPIGPPCSGLLTEIDLLARTHGKAPERPPPLNP